MLLFVKIVLLFRVKGLISLLFFRLAMVIRTFHLLGLLFFFTCLPGFAQTKEQKAYYTRISTENFRSNSLFNELIDFRKIDYARINAAIFFLTNEVRIRNHLPSLEYAPQLENSATLHAQDMLTENFFSHINPNHKEKKTPNDRAILCHVSNPFLAENIIEGYGLQYKSNETVYLRGKGKFSKTPDGELLKPHTYLSFGETLVTGWMNSKDHRKNILAKEAVQLGCGVSYFVDPEFNDMPSFKAVQNFQWYRPIIPSNR